MIDTAQRSVKPGESSQQLLTQPLQSGPGGHKPDIVVGTADGLWILNTAAHHEHEQSLITAIAPVANGWWMICDRTMLWHRILDGEWHQVAAVDNLRLDCLLPIGERLLLGTSEAHLLQLVQGQLQPIEAFEHAAGRDEWYTPWGGLPDVRSLAVGAADEWYVNIHVGGILRSDDQGQTWQPTLDLHADVHEVLTVAAHPDLVVAATASGLALSTDRGDHWSFDRAGLHASYARAIAVGADQIIMSVSQGPSGNQAALYRRPLHQAGAFEKCEHGLPQWFSSNINTGCLAMSGEIAAFGTQDGQVFGSRDGGQTWELWADGLPPIHCLRLV